MKKAAGLLIYRQIGETLEVILVHPGGPFWKNKNTDAWSIPKGEFTDEEEPLHAAIREVKEETGLQVKGEFITLQPVRQKSGKMIYAWAVEGDYDVSEITSNTFPLEWPPRSGKYIEIPEVDKAAWFAVAEAKLMIIPGQVPILEELIELLARHTPHKSSS